MAESYRFSSDSLGAAERQLIVALATQTGDQTHVAAAAALDQRTDVLIIFSLEGTPKTEAREAGAKYFQRPTGNSTSPKRVHQICLKEQEDARKLYNLLVDGDNGWRRNTGWIKPKNNKDRTKINKLKAMTSENGGKTVEGELAKILEYSPGMFYQTLQVLSATFIIAEKMAAPSTLQQRIDLYGLFATRMGSDLDPQTILKHDDFKNIPFPTGQKPVLLLWARYTGGNKPTGYNPEGDSDLLGQKQLLQLAEKTLGTFDVITVGHDPEGATEKDWVHAKCHIGEFYRKRTIDSDRGRQLSFMLALMQKYPGKLFQIGQKTGGMDAGAMAGIPTLYIEDVGSGTKNRMRTWVGSVPFYSCALVTEPPTLLGRALRMVDFELKQSSEATLALLFAAAKEPRYVTGERGRRWAQYYYVLNASRAMNGEVVDIVTVKQAVDPSQGTVDPVKAKATDEEIAKLAALLQTEGYYVRGYNPGKQDFDLIQQQLVALVAAYNKEDAVVRNSSGQYVARKALKNQN